MFRLLITVRCQNGLGKADTISSTVVSFSDEKEQRRAIGNMAHENELKQNLVYHWVSV